MKKSKIKLLIINIHFGFGRGEASWIQLAHLALLLAIA